MSSFCPILRQDAILTPSQGLPHSSQGADSIQCPFPDFLHTPSKLAFYLLLLSFLLSLDLSRQLGLTLYSQWGRDLVVDPPVSDPSSFIAKELPGPFIFWNIKTTFPSRP